MAQEKIQVVDTAQKVADLPSDRKLYSMNLNPETAEKFKKIFREWKSNYTDVREQVVGDFENGVVQDEIEDRYIKSAAEIINKEDEMWILLHPNDSNGPIESVESRALRLIKAMIEGCKKNSEKIYGSAAQKQEAPSAAVIEIPAIEVPTVPSTDVISLPPQQSSDIDNSEKKIEIGGQEIAAGANVGANRTSLDSYFNSSPAGGVESESINAIGSFDDKDKTINEKLMNHAQEIGAVMRKKYVPMSDEQIAESQKKLAEVSMSDEAKKLRADEEQNNAEVAAINEKKGYTEQESEKPLRDDPIPVIPRPEPEEGLISEKVAPTEEVIPEFRTVNNIKEDKPVADVKDDKPVADVKDDKPVADVKEASEEKVTEPILVGENENVGFKPHEKEKEQENGEEPTEPVITESNPGAKSMVVSVESKARLEEYNNRMAAEMARSRELKQQSSSIDQELETKRKEKGEAEAQEKAARQASEVAQADKAQAEKELNDAYARALEFEIDLNAKIERDNQNKQKMSEAITSDTNSILQNIENLNKDAEFNRDAAKELRSRASELEGMFAEKPEQTSGFEYKI